MHKQNLLVLGLSKKEGKILVALQDGLDTPVLLSKTTKVSRPAIYAILNNLKKRGLVGSTISNGKKHWSLTSERDIEEILYSAKRTLLKIPEGREEIHGRIDSAVIVHRGERAIKKLMAYILLQHHNEKLHGLQGNVSSVGWDKMFKAEETNHFNAAIKKNGVIVEAILPQNWLELQIKELGVVWAQGFEGRTTQVNTIDTKYFAHGGQMFVFKNSLYLLALNEEIVIEIKNSEIQKMILALFSFIQENSRTIDANAILRKLMTQQNISL